MIIFRFNITSDFATGHLFRAIALKKIFDAFSIGQEYIFLIYSDKLIDNYASLLKNYNHKIFNNSADEFKILKTFQKKNNDILILDVKDTETEYIARLKELNFKIIGFDDTGAGAKMLDLLIDANIHTLETSEKQMFGSDYILLDPVFANINKQHKEIKKEPESGILFFGGADTAGISEFISENFNSLLFKNCRLNIIFKQTHISAPHNSNLRIISRNLTAAEISELYFKNDFAVISGGISLYECMCCGCPAIVINQNSEQFINSAHYNNFIVNAGVFDKSNALEILNDTFNQIRCSAKRASLSESSKKKIDGLGYLRIMERIKTLIYGK